MFGALENGFQAEAACVGLHVELPGSNPEGYDAGVEQVLERDVLDLVLLLDAGLEGALVSEAARLALAPATTLYLAFNPTNDGGFRVEWSRPRSSNPIAAKRLTTI